MGTIPTRQGRPLLLVVRFFSSVSMGLTMAVASTISKFSSSAAPYAPSSHLCWSWNSNSSSLQSELWWFSIWAGSLQHLHGTGQISNAFAQARILPKLAQNTNFFMVMGLRAMVSVLMIPSGLVSATHPQQYP